MPKEKDSDKLAKKVGYLNEAAISIRSAIDKIKLVYKGDNDMETLIWRTEKAVNEMQTFIMKRLQNECIKEDFDETIKGFDKIFRRKNNGKKKK